MGDRIRFALSAAFYLLALAVTVSGLISQWFAILLTVLATALLGWAARHHAHEWHKTKKQNGERGLDSWYVIVPAGLIAVSAFGVFAYGLGSRSSVAATSPQQGTEAVPAKANTHRAATFLKDAQIITSNGTINLSGTWTKTLPRVRVCRAALSD
jgi:hypothetical protein